MGQGIKLHPFFRKPKVRHSALMCNKISLQKALGFSHFMREVNTESAILILFKFEQRSNLEFRQL